MGGEEEEVAGDEEPPEEEGVLGSGSDHFWALLARSSLPA